MSWRRVPSKSKAFSHMSRLHLLRPHPEGSPSRREGERLEGWAAYVSGPTSADLMVRDAALARGERGPHHEAGRVKRAFHGRALWISWIPTNRSLHLRIRPDAPAAANN